MKDQHWDRFGPPEVLESVESTNDYIRRYLAERKCRVVTAAGQTGGRGRFGRVWHSPPGAGLYVSFLLFPAWDARWSVLLNAAAALSVVRTLRNLAPGLSLRIKEPNDVLVNGRKISGILVELATQGVRIDWAVVGIGLNVLQHSFPPDLPHATSLALEGVNVESAGSLLAPLTHEFEALLKVADAGDGAALLQAVEKEK